MTYVPNRGAPKYIKEILTELKGEIDSNKIIVRNFSIPLLTIIKSSRQKINKTTLDLNYTLDEKNLTDIYRIFHPKAAGYIFFSSAHETFSRIDHVISQHKS